MSKQSGWGSDREAFDRSFEFFESHDGEDDPWSVVPGPANKKLLETSFESDPFSAISSIKPEDTNFTLFPQDPFVSSSVEPVPPTPTVSTVRVGVHEQLSAFYDDMSTQGSVHVAGSIHVKPAFGGIPGPFCLVCRDLLDQIERLDARTDVCLDITDQTKLHGLQHPTDRVLRVTLPNPLTGPATEGIAVANYVCSPGLRPVPMLVKSRVQASGDIVRVGFKVRANPSNDFSLKRIMIVLAVPPNVDGQSVRMSRQGGMWDEMKRTVSWSVAKLEAGEALEIQTQFTAVDGGATTSGRKDRAPPKFPVLVRSDCSKLFSSVEVLGDFDDGFSSPIRVMPSSFSRILHRKV